jgi:transposase InsO family protein
MNLTTRSRPRPYRGTFGQQDRRRVERTVRVAAVAFARWLRRADQPASVAAECLGIAPGTLRGWSGRWRADHMTIRSRGRPVQRAQRDQRLSILALFGLLGPQLGLPTLQEFFPDVARGELIDLQRRYRHAYRRRNAVLLHTLRWTMAGSVWAMDFATPLHPIDGHYPRLFVVRDLATGYQLLASPALGETTRMAVDVLSSLFAAFGAPLVIKSDNGSAFTALKMRAFLAQHQVLHLFSPEGTPAYNGSIEAGIGSMKTRTHYEAARHDHPGLWTCDDVEAARCQANATARPQGPRAPTPDDAWADRISLNQVQRSLLHSSYEEHVRREQQHRGLDSGPFRDRDRASIDRIAIGRALIDGDFLLIRRRRISPPLIRRQIAKIS